MTATDKAADLSLDYTAAYSDFLTALDELQAAGAVLEAAYRADPTRQAAGRGNGVAVNLSAHLATARIANVAGLGELRRVLAPEGDE